MTLYCLVAYIIFLPPSPCFFYITMMVNGYSAEVFKLVHSLCMHNILKVTTNYYEEILTRRIKYGQ